MQPLSLSVAICTWNRCQLLSKTLESLTELTLPPETSWEVVVVNNLCTDDTDRVIANFAERLPLRRLIEREAGLSNARNRALEEVRGDYVVFTDDDVLVDREWLASYARAFRRWPEAAIFGGPIEPLFEGEPPIWMPSVLETMGPVFGRQNLGGSPVSLTEECIGDGPYGGNFALRRSALAPMPFSPELGAHHCSYRLGEETELFRSLLAAGETGWWSPEPRVQHWIPHENQTLGYVRRWMEACGEYEWRHVEPKSKGGPLRTFVTLLRHESLYRIRRLLSPPEFWITHLARASKARGALRAQKRHGSRALR